MSVLDQKAATAEAYISAGNLDLAQKLCSEILGQNPTHQGGYSALFRILRRRGDTHNAQRLCLWRLSQLPDCMDTHMDYLQVLSENYQREKATAQILSMREGLGDRPVSLAEANIVYSHYFGKPKATLRLIEKARDAGQMSKYWLDYFELMTRDSAGHIIRKREMLEEIIQDDPNDPDTIVELADTYFKTGRLKKAISLCRRGLDFGQDHASRLKTIKAMSCLLYVPLLWPAGLVLLFHHNVIKRLGVFPQIFAFGLVLFLLPLFVLLAYVGLKVLWPDFPYNLWVVFVFANGLFIFADLFLIDFLQADLGEDKKTIKLSKEY